MSDKNKGSGLKNLWPLAICIGMAVAGAVGAQGLDDDNSDVGTEEQQIQVDTIQNVAPPPAFEQ